MSIPTFFEPDALREMPGDEAQLQRVLSELETTARAMRDNLHGEPSEENVAHLGRALQKLSEAQRLANRFEEARASKAEAIAIWQKLGRAKAHFLCRMKLAMIDHQAGEFERAATALEALEDELDQGFTIYTDFLAEARARCYHALGRRDAATAQIQRALKVRLARGNARHIEVTRNIEAIITSGG
ncbi:hypothetical protein FRC98_15480 [Lujinxingia vulgaris]|uniref:Tetratricopeptide repeat protein n=1 Tax=Lujinxingia vulgaris TaxID=2600176 RepID=A0A5C6XBY0_9DELT|nr:hypothetical protein [Lujinxingia vulgaris]TXD35608.1 hypothetical protein FRC98_15480 [Lujinxingia vulgaris]